MAEPNVAPQAGELDRRAALNAAKLGALVRDRWGVDPAALDAQAVGTGAAAGHDRRAFVLLDEGSPGSAGAATGRGLGSALAFADRVGADELHVISDDADAGTMARQALEFTLPITVWRSEGRILSEVGPEPVPETLPPPDAPELVGLLHAQGVEVVVEGDRLAAEVNGLEVARIVRALDDGEPLLEVGVGRFDRELTAMLHAGLTPAEALARVVEQVRAIRRPGGANHPLARLVPERWLRARLIADPSLIGCDELMAVPGPVPRDRLRERGVAVAVGTRGGRPVVVAATAGADLEAVPRGADARAHLDPDATLLVVGPERDLLPITGRLVARLRRPAEVVGVVGDWKA